jgi:hypothetical protein
MFVSGLVHPKNQTPRPVRIRGHSAVTMQMADKQEEGALQHGIGRQCNGPTVATACAIPADHLKARRHGYQRIVHPLSTRFQNCTTVTVVTTRQRSLYRYGPVWPCTTALYPCIRRESISACQPDVQPPTGRQDGQINYLDILATFMKQRTYLATLLLFGHLALIWSSC